MKNKKDIYKIAAEIKLSNPNMTHKQALDKAKEEIKKRKNVSSGLNIKLNGLMGSDIDVPGVVSLGVNAKYKYLSCEVRKENGSNVVFDICLRL